MSTNEVLWTILQERRRQAAEAARERSATTVARSRGGISAGIAAWLREHAVHRHDERLRPAEGGSGR
jgi:hypothetical protein